MAIQLSSLPLPETADPSKFADFGREVKGVDPGTMSPEQFEQVKEALYKVCYLSARANWVIEYSPNPARCSSVPRRPFDA